VASRWQDLGEERFQRLLYVDADVRRRQKICCIDSAEEKATRLCSETVVAEVPVAVINEERGGGGAYVRERRVSEVG